MELRVGATASLEVEPKVGSPVRHPGSPTSRPRSSRLPRTRASHLVEDLIDGPLKRQRCPDPIDRMDISAVLTKEDAFLSDFEGNRRAGYEPEPFPYLGRHGDFAFW